MIDTRRLRAPYGDKILRRGCLLDLSAQDSPTHLIMLPLFHANVPHRPTTHLLPIEAIKHEITCGAAWVNTQKYVISMQSSHRVAGHRRGGHNVEKVFYLLSVITSGRAIECHKNWTKGLWSKAGGGCVSPAFSLSSSNLEPAPAFIKAFINYTQYKKRLRIFTSSEGALISS